MAEDRPAGQGESASTPLGGGASRARSPRPEPQAEARHPGESQPRHPAQRRPQSRPRSGRRPRTGDLQHQSLPHAQAQLGPLPRPAPETGTDTAVGACPAGTGDDWDQEASLAAIVARIEADRAAGLIDPDELDEDDGLLPFGDDWPDEGFVRLGDDWPGKGPAVTAGEADVGAPEHAPVPEGGPVPEHAPVPEVLDAGFLPRGRAAGQSGTPPAPGGPSGPGWLPTGSPPVPASAPGLGPSDNRPGAGFASGEVLDSARPGPVLAAAADVAAGLGRAYTGVSDDELVGVLTAWQRTESWAAAGRLSAAAELIRRRPATGRARAGRAGVPLPWGKFCADELAAALAISRWAAEKMTALAHDLATRLPLTRQALHEGVIDAYKAQVIAEVTRCLDAAAAAAAEAAIVPDRVTGKTPGQIRAEVARAVLKADPAAARQRREQAQKDARVELWREDAGTAAIVGFGLPPDEALAADQQITSRALDLKAAGVPGSMDALRVRAYLDALLGQDTAARYQTTSSQHNRPESNCPSSDSPASDDADGSTPGSDSPGSNSPSSNNPATDNASGSTGNNSPGNNSPGDGSPGRYDSEAPDRGQDGEPAAPAGGTTQGDNPAPEQPSGTGPDSPPPAPIRPAATINLTIPLATLLGLAEHPGQVTGFGPIDPALARTLAAEAAAHPATTWCITVTDPDGRPLAHGCAKERRRRRQPHRRPGRTGSTGPPDDYGTWRLRPGGRGTPGKTGRAGWPELAVDLEPIPVDGCDHRHQTTAHDPSPALRHLVEIRDGECTWPPCRRHATRCDYDHTVPWEQGGPTCACNGGPRCRHHHHTKQAHGWKLEQNQPGYHTWTTPAGRSYTSGPTQYPI
jgi:Domain of unknown function (DUF222)